MMPPPNNYGYPPPPPGGPPGYYPYPPPPYYPPGMGMAPPPRDDGDAVTIFVLGLCGLLVCQLLAPIAWVKGNTYRTTCRMMDVQPNGLATAGWILGIIGTVILGLSFLWVAFVVLVSAAG